jgi:hypothetical protein
MTAVNPDEFGPAFPLFVEEESVRAAEAIVHPEALVAQEVSDLPVDEKLRLNDLSPKEKKELAVIGLEVTPANEAARIAVGAVVGWITKEPLATGGAYGLATLLIEGGAGLAAADLFSTENGKKALERVNNLFAKVGIPPEAKANVPIKAGAAMFGGTAILMGLQHRDNPDASKMERRRKGLISAVSLAGMCAVQGYLTAKGVATPNPKNIGLGVGAFGGAIAYGSWAKNKLVSSVKDREPQAIEEQPEEAVTPANNKRRFRHRKTQQA